MIRFVLLVIVLTLAACSEPIPVAPYSADKDGNEERTELSRLVFSHSASKDGNEMRQIVWHLEFSRPAGKANCALCGFLDDDRYTIADGQGAPVSPDSTSSSETAAEAENV